MSPSPPSFDHQPHQFRCHPSNQPSPFTPPTLLYNPSCDQSLNLPMPQPVTPPQPTPGQPIQPISTQASQAFPDQTNSPTVSLVLPPTTPSPTQTTTPSTETPLGQNPLHLPNRPVHQRRVILQSSPLKIHQLWRQPLGVGQFQTE